MSASQGIYLLAGDIQTSYTNTVTASSGNVMIVVFTDDRTRTVSECSASTSLLQPVTNWVRPQTLPRHKPPLPELGHDKRGAKFERRRNGFQQLARVPCYRGTRTR